MPAGSDGISLNNTKVKVAIMNRVMTISTDLRATYFTIDIDMPPSCSVLVERWR
jgi:hypothetical protein